MSNLRDEIDIDNATLLIALEPIQLEQLAELIVEKLDKEKPPE